VEDACVILLGASQFPRYPQLSANEAFRRSSRGLLTYLQQVLGVSPLACLDLFDGTKGPAEQCDAIAAFLTEQSSRRSVIVHYVGHGTFDDQRQHALLCRTSKERNWPSFLATRHLVHALREHAPDKRMFLLLDCCFAGAAASFQVGDEDLQARRVQELATRGLAFFVACPRSDVAIGSDDEQYTRFTGAILGVLEDGITGGPAMLSLEDLNDKVRARLRAAHGPAMPLPEIHRPDQAHGDPARVPLFPNRAWQAPPGPGDSVEPIAPGRISPFVRPLRLAALVFAIIGAAVWLIGRPSNPIVAVDAPLQPQDAPLRAEIVPTDYRCSIPCYDWNVAAGACVPSRCSRPCYEPDPHDGCLCKEIECVKGKVLDKECRCVAESAVVGSGPRLRPLNSGSVSAEAPGESSGRRPEAGAVRGARPHLVDAPPPPQPTLPGGAAESTPDWSGDRICDEATIRGFGEDLATYCGEKGLSEKPSASVGTRHWWSSGGGVTECDCVVRRRRWQDDDDQSRRARLTVSALPVEGISTCDPSTITGSGKNADQVCRIDGAQLRLNAARYRVGSRYTFSYGGGEISCDCLLISGK